MSVAPHGALVRRLMRDISSVLIISGLILLLDAGVTLLWQEPVTAAIGLVKRAQLNTGYRDEAAAQPA